MNNDIIIYLYRGIFTRKMDECQDNYYMIDGFRDMIEEVEEFVFNNIHELVHLR